MSINKIGILTSGGDAPGMNAAVRAVVLAGLNANKEVYFIYDGYKGLIEGHIEKATREAVQDINLRGGTILHSARLPEFKEVTVREKAVAILKEIGIDALVVIGGDGSWMGALRLYEMGINCVGLPGTIDNDISSCDYTIGFDTALNTICSSVDKLKDTSYSHHRCALIEVMGRYCGDLAMYSGIACGADIIISSDMYLSKEQIIEEVKALQAKGKQYIIIIVTEHTYNVHELAKEIEAGTGIETREEVVGRIQRGGSPTAFDRILATRMGVYAVDLICEGKSGICVGLKGSDLVYYNIEDALKIERKNSNDLIDVIKKVR